MMKFSIDLPQSIALLAFSLVLSAAIFAGSKVFVAGGLWETTAAPTKGVIIQVNRLTGAAYFCTRGGSCKRMDINKGS